MAVYRRGKSVCDAQSAKLGESAYSENKRSKILLYGFKNSYAEKGIILLRKRKKEKTNKVKSSK